MFSVLIHTSDRSVEESAESDTAADDDIASGSANEKFRIGSELLRKIDVIIENQKTLIVSLNAVVDCLKSALSK